VVETAYCAASRFVLITKYCVGDETKKNEMVEVRGMFGDKTGSYRVLVQKPEAKRTVGRPKCGWRDNIKV